MTRAKRIGLAIVAAGLATALSGGVALADHQRAVCEVSAVANTKVDLGYVLSVRLATTEGKPVNDAPVRFYESVELLGPREMLIASVVTDGQGRVSVAYLPARTGSHEIVVRFAGRDHLGAVEGRTTFEATVAAPPYREEPMPLAAFSARVPYAVGAIVLAVWSLIAFALFGTARGIFTGAHTDGKENTA